MMKYYLQQDNATDNKRSVKFQLFLSNEANKNDEQQTAMDIDENFEGWKCSTCTLINESKTDECDACYSKRPEHASIKTVVVNEVEKLKDQKLHDYMAFDLQNLIENTEKFECEICLDDEVGPREGAVLKECLHVFCKYFKKKI